MLSQYLNDLLFNNSLRISQSCNRIINLADKEESQEHILTDVQKELEKIAFTQKMMQVAVDQNMPKITNLGTNQ